MYADSINTEIIQKLIVSVIKFILKYLHKIKMDKKANRNVRY